MNLLLIFCLVVTIGIVSGYQIPYFHRSYTGARVKTQHAIDSRHCYAICKRIPNCSNWSFFIRPGKCVLYSSVSGTKPQKGVVSGDLASATNGPNNLENMTDDTMICDEDLNTLHGLLIASSNTFVAHCYNNGITTKKIICGNGVDCSSACDVTPTCAKVVFEFGMGTAASCPSSINTSCNKDTFGVSKPKTTTDPIVYPGWCTTSDSYVNALNWKKNDPRGQCCNCPKCDWCGCCTILPLTDIIEKMNSIVYQNFITSSQSSPVNIEWKTEMKKEVICVSPGTKITFNWNSDDHHSVDRISHKDWDSCKVPENAYGTKTGPFTFDAYGDGNITSYFFTSGVADDCQNRMKAEITVSNCCNTGTSLFATCDNKMRIYYDGVLQFQDPGWPLTETEPHSWTIINGLCIPSGTSVLGIECHNIERSEGNYWGILASTKNLVTDEKWRCTSNQTLVGWAKLDFVDTYGDFSAASTVTGPWNLYGYDWPNISTSAKWIWSKHSEYAACKTKLN